MNNGSGGSEDGASPGWMEVNLTFDTMRQLQAELAPHLSNDGLFIPCEDPFEPDTVVRFRVSLPEEFVLIEGTGVVIWTRDAAEDEGPSGMAVRYASLSREAQETIDAVIDAHLASGGELFDLDPGPGREASFPTDALDPGTRREEVDREEAREATARQLAQARVTIRDTSATEPEPAAPGGEAELVGSLEEEYLASVEAQVEDPATRVREDDVDKEMEGLGWADRGRPPPEEPEQPMFEGFDIRSESLEQRIGLEAPPRAVDATEQPTTPSEAGVTEDIEQPPSVDEPAEPGVDAREAGERDEPEVIESVIPVFLERWKREIGDTASEGVSGQQADIQPEEAEAPRTAAGDSGGSDRFGPPGERFSDDGGEAVPVEPPPEFEVSVVTDAAEPDDTPVRDHGPDAADVTLAPSDPGSGLGRRWWLPALGVAVALVVVIGGYLGWGWYRDRGQEPATPLLTVETGPAEPEETTGADEPEIAGSMESATLEGEDGGRAAPDQVESEAETPSAPAVPATAVESIVWRAASGETTVEIRGNGAISDDAVSVFPMGDPPRILVRLRWIEEQYPEFELEVGTPEVSRIRTGLHPELTPPALYVVLDLSGPGVGVADVTVSGDVVRVTVAAP